MGERGRDREGVVDFVRLSLSLSVHIQHSQNTFCVILLPPLCYNTSEHSLVVIKMLEVVCSNCNPAPTNGNTKGYC